MVKASEVQELNGKIEKINIQRTKEEARADMLQKQLEGKLKEYETMFGVKLKGKSFNATKKLISEELKKVTEEVEKEYNLKNEVVSAIEGGDYDKAYALLGIEKKQSDEEDEDEKVIGEVGGAEDLSESFGFDAGDLTVDDDDEDLITVSDDDNVEEPVKPVTSGRNEGASSFMSAVKSAVSEEKKPTVSVSKMNTGSKRVEHKIPGTDMVGAFGDLQVEDDILPSIDDNDFGFGDILKGSKFGGED